MDFLPLIIGIVVAIIIGAKNSSKKKQQSAPSAPHGENFPFPKEFAELFGMNDEQPQSVASAEQSTRGVEDRYAGEEGVSMTVAQYKEHSDRTSKAHVAIEVDEPIEIENRANATGERYEFDLRKAVIYSEILKPKYNDDIF